MSEQLIETIEKALDNIDGTPWRVATPSPNGRQNVGTKMGLMICQTFNTEDAHLIANAPEWLRALLEENKHWKQCFLDANADWARTGNELGDVRTELEQVKAELQALKKGDGRVE